MTVTYCTVAQTISKVGLIDESDGSRFVASATTKPSTTEVEEWINEAEKEIERFTQTAWQSITVPNEYHPFNRPSHINLQILIMAKLDFSPPKTFDTAQGDKIEVFEGDAWYDLVANGTEGSGLGDGDYWVDLESGIVYIITRFPIKGQNTIRISYRYGNATVPADIRNACTLLAALNLLQSDTYIQNFPQNTDRFSLSSLADNFEKRAYKILNNHRVWRGI